MEVGCHCHALASLPPQKRPGTPSTWGWVGLRASLHWVRKISPTSGFDPRAFQPIASRHTDSKKISFVFSSLCARQEHFAWFQTMCLWNIYKKICFSYLINFLMSLLMLNCWLSKCFNYLVALVITCWCLQTNSQVTLAVHLRKICVAGLKSKWHGSDRMAHMPLVLMRTTHTRMHQVSFYTISWTHSVSSSINWRILWVWLCTAAH